MLIKGWLLSLDVEPNLYQCEMVTLELQATTTVVTFPWERTLYPPGESLEESFFVELIFYSSLECLFPKWGNSTDSESLGDACLVEEASYEPYPRCVTFDSRSKNRVNGS